ncbi:MAG: hypothetical protein ACOCVO_02055, partial [bacterium]
MANRITWYHVKHHQLTVHEDEILEVILPATFILTGNWILLFLVTLAPFTANWLNFLCGLPQHLGLLPSVPDFRLCCAGRSSTTSRPRRRASSARGARRSCRSRGFSAS